MKEIAYRTVEHVPGEGEPDHVWWFGFDCAHYMDKSPGFRASLSALRAPLEMGGALLDGTYRDLAYVRTQCAELAQQLSSLAAPAS